MGLASTFFAGMTAGPYHTGGQSVRGWMPLSLQALGETYAGVEVNEQKAMTISAVYRSIALISETVAMLPIAVLKKDGERRERVEDHPVSRVLQYPNEAMNAVDLRTTMQAHALQYGNGYTNIQRSQSGEPLKLWPMLPDRTRLVSVDGQEGKQLVYETVVDGKQIKVDPMDVAHVRGLGFDGLRGYSPLRLAQQGLGLTLALEEYGSKFFSNDAKSGGIVEHPGKITDKVMKNLRDSWSAQSGLKHAHRIKILEEGMKFNATSISPEDSQFLMTRTFQTEEIARLYGIPLHMLQSHAKSTSWGSGIAQMSLGFLIYTLEPWLVRWEQEYGRKLFTEQELADGYYLRHNVTALLRGDPASRSSYYSAALNKQTGWMVRDEVRALEDMNPDDVENEMPQAQSFGAPAPDETPDDDDDETEETDED